MGAHFERHTRPRDDEIRDRVATEFDGVILIPRGAGGTDHCTHAPAAGEAVEPLCQKSLTTSTWYETSLAVYPPGHLDWCENCVVRLFHDRANDETEVHI